MTTKSLDFAPDKFFEVSQLQPDDKNALTAWVKLYFQVQVIGGSKNTTRSKQNDFKSFLVFFLEGIGQDNLDYWTPAITKAFIKEEEDKGKAATSINRCLATLRHFSKWVHTQRPFIAGNPFDGVKDLSIAAPDWNGLDSREIMRLKAACEQRIALCTRKNQNPLKETAIFYVLLYTGLREFELCGLNVGQYQDKGFYHVRRKGSKVDRKVTVPNEARLWLERYLESREDVSDSDPLFIGVRGNRLTPDGVYQVCERIVNQANVGLSEKEMIHLTPHMLRHTRLKKIADKYGVHVAQEFSGNTSMKVIFNYTKPSQKEKDEMAEGLT